MLFLAGCSNRSGKENSTGEVVAEVNGVEITQRQLNFLFNRSGLTGLSTSDKSELKKQILADLIRTELLAQKAEKLNIRNSPDYALAIYSSEKNVMADMAAEKLSQSVVKVDEDEIYEIVKNNPRLFQNRKMYIYNEIYIHGVKKDLLANFDKEIGDGKKIDQIIDELRKNKIKYSVSARMKTSDQLPQELEYFLEKTITGKPQIITISDQYSLIIELSNKIPVPITGNNAFLVAEKMHKQELKRSIVEKEINNLLNTADIKYYGEFADSKDINNKSGLLYPDAAKGKKIKLISLVLSSSLAISFVSVIMIMTASIRIITGKLWIPHIRSVKKDTVIEEDSYDIIPEIHYLQKSYLFILFTSTISIIFYQLYLLIDKIDFINIVFGVTSGIILGIILSRIFKISALQKWTDMKFNIIAIIFTLPVIASLLLTMRYTLV